MDRRDSALAEAQLPDYYETVAQDLLDYVGRRDGVWMDVGSGAGGLGLAVAARHSGVMLLLDPDAEALGRALQEARERSLGDRTIAVIGVVEALPFPAGSVDVVISRGSFFFWNDRAAGLREIYRVMRPGGKAMIGGGLGSRYPQWARQEFIRRRRGSAAAGDPEEAKRFALARHPETFRRLAEEAGLPSFEIVGEGGLSEDHPQTGIGIWLRFAKEGANDRG